jgi:hypothetical protein
MQVDIQALITSIENMIDPKIGVDNVTKKEIQKAIKGIAEKTWTLSDPEKGQLNEVMGKILDWTKNPGTNSLAKLWYFIFQGTRRDARVFAANIILQNTELENAKDTVAWKKIDEELKERKVDMLLLNALLAKYKPHGLKKSDLNKLNDLQLARLYAVTGELDLSKVAKEHFNTESFLQHLIQAAAKKKDYKMMRNIFLAAEKAPSPERIQSLQKELMKEAFPDVGHVELSQASNKDKIKETRDFAFSQIEQMETKAGAEGATD